MHGGSHASSGAAARGAARTLSGAALAGAMIVALGAPAQAQITGDVDVGVSESSTVPGCIFSGGAPVVGTKAMSLAEAKVQKVGQGLLCGRARCRDRVLLASGHEHRGRATGRRRAGHLNGDASALLLQRQLGTA